VNVNVLLAGLTFTPAANFNGSFTIATSVSDGAASITGSKAVSGIAVNDAPTASIGPSAFGVNEDDGYRLLGGISVSDPDAGSNELAVTLGVGQGLIRLATTTGLTFTGGANDSAGMTFAGLMRRRASGPVVASCLGLLFLAEANAVPVPTNLSWRSSERYRDSWDHVSTLNEGPLAYRYLIGMPADTVVLELPLGEASWDLRYVYYAGLHGKRIVNGYSGYYPPGYGERTARLAKFGEEPDEEDADAALRRTAAPDTGTRVYRTTAGRTVYGGGGIRPDVVVTPDSLTGVLRAVETRGLAFRFANLWITTHPGAGPADALDDATRAGFAAFLDSIGVKSTAAEREAAGVALDRALRRELARRRDGDGAAARVALEGDPVFARALEVLRAARLPRDVFAAAVVPPAPAPAAGAKRAGGAASKRPTPPGRSPR